MTWLRFGLYLFSGQYLIVIVRWWMNLSAGKTALWLSGALTFLAAATIVHFLR